MSDNLISALISEIERNHELIHLYRSIGPAGNIAAALFEQDIKAAKQAIADMDTAEMVRSLARLRENKA